MSISVGVLVFGAGACGPGDNSGAVKAYAGIEAGMFIWDAIDHAEQTQFPDITFTARGRQCSHPGVEVGRKAGPRYLRVLRRELDAAYPASGHAYLEEGFATRGELIAAVRSKVALFSGCEAIGFFMGRYQGWPAGDSFDVTVGLDGRIKTVTPLEEIRWD